MAKIHKSLRLSKKAERQLKWLTRQYLMSESEIIQMALDKLFTSKETEAIAVLLTMSDEDINEQLRQLTIADGDENTEHPDTQYSDYPHA